VIILSGVLVVVAIALLVTGIVTGNTGHEVAGLDGLKLIYVSIGVSIISALCLAIGVFLRRKELFGSAESATAKRSAASRSGRTARPAKAKARVGAGDDAPPVPAPSATALDVPAETSVFVIPGRKRYHLETCRQLAGRDKEELTFVEAREEGFTACTACLPDTALAARAALTETEPAEDADARSTETLDSAADTADLRHRDEDPAQVTRTDLPVTRLETDTADTDIAEVEPAAPSPAAADLHDASEPDATAETDETADTSQFDEVETSPEPAAEPAAEPAEERPSARSRSFFEPLQRPGTSPAEDEAEDEDTAEARTSTEPDLAEPAPADEIAEIAEIAERDEDAVASPEPVESSELEDAVAEDLHEPEPADEEPTPEPEDLHPSEPETEPEDASAAPELVDDETEPSETTTDAAHETPEPEPAETDATLDASAATVDEDTSADASEDPADHPDLPFVRILSGTKRYHRPDCALIEDIADDADDLETVSPAEAKNRGCTPCLVCQPDKDPSDDLY
jgi:hypothetical protein